MLRLHGLELEDENDNRYPEIFTKALNPTSTAMFHQQVNEFFAPLRERGLELAGISAYLDKCPRDDDHEFYSWNTEVIMKNLAEQPDNNQIVFIWDIGDITMLTTNHLEELNMLKPEINMGSLYNFRELICENVNNLQGSYKIVKDVVNIEDAFIGKTKKRRKAASVYEALRKLYNSVQLDDKKGLIPHDLLVKCGMVERKAELCQAAKEHQKVFNRRWKYAKRCIELVNKRSAKSTTKKYANVVLCEEGVASGLSQLLMAGFSSIINVENVYSTVEESDYERARAIKSVIHRIQQRYDEKCFLIHVTSGPSYAEIPIPRWPIQANEAVKFLYTAQRDFLLQKNV